VSDSVYFGLFIVGIFLLTGALVVGVGAFEYEVTSLGTVEEVPDDTESLVAYDSLSERDRGTVQRALSGERLVVRDPTEEGIDPDAALSYEDEWPLHVFELR